MIALKYINKNEAAIAAIRDYNNMQFIINNTSQDIKDLYEEMTSPRSSNLSGTPSARNPQVGSEILAAQIDKIDVMQGRYSQALEYMTWFDPAWSSLSDTERHVLSEFYMGENQKSGATYRLMNELNYSERKIEQMRSEALRHLRILLYG